MGDKQIGAVRVVESIHVSGAAPTLPVRSTLRELSRPLNQTGARAPSGRLPARAGADTQISMPRLLGALQGVDGQLRERRRSSEYVLFPERGSSSRLRGFDRHGRGDTSGRGVSLLCP